MPKILTWNILSGGGRRIPGIVESIFKHESDVLVLIEYRTGSTLSKELELAGYTHQHHNLVKSAVNGVLIAAKEPFSQIDMPDGLRDMSHLCIGTIINGRRIIGVFCCNETANARLLPYLAGLQAPFRTERTFMIGDFNAGPQRSRPARYSGLAELVFNGYVDLWRTIKGNQAEWSCVTGRGASQPDRAFASPKMVPEIVDIRYSHSEREQGLSDHSVLLVTIRDCAFE